MYGTGSGTGKLAATGVTVMAVGGHSFSLAWVVGGGLVLVAGGVLLLRLGGRRRRYAA